MIKPIRYDSTLESERLHLLAFCNVYSLYYLFENNKVNDWTLFLKLAIPRDVTIKLQGVIKRINKLGELLENTIDVLTDNCLVSMSNMHDLLSKDYMEQLYYRWETLPKEYGENNWIVFISNDQPDPCPEVCAEFFAEIVNDYDIWS